MREPRGGGVDSPGVVRLARSAHVGPLKRSRQSGALILRTALLGLWVLTAAVSSDAASADTISAAVSKRVAQVLADRQVDLSAKWPGGQSRGLRDVFRETVSAVPLVITQDSIGSSVVVHTDRQTGIALLVTNHHVVTSPSSMKRKRLVLWCWYFTSRA
jgi:hypothetical protein